MTPQIFFERNCKWFALILLLLLGFKSMQSCNRNTKLKMGSAQYIEQIDSLKNIHNTYYKITQDSIKELNYELKLAKEQVHAANERADAVQTAVEKVRSNTTITVKGVEEVKDTNKNK
jgi:hypothetical protein